MAPIDNSSGTRTGSTPDEDRDFYELEEQLLAQVEDPGPEPAGYRPVLWLSIGVVLGAIVYYIIVEHVLPLSS